MGVRLAVMVLGLTIGMLGQTKQAPQAASSRVAMAIRGIWWSHAMPQSAAFQISDSTIYYPDAFVECRYWVRGDSLFVYRDEGVSGTRIVKVNADTLVLSSYGGKEVYTRKEPAGK